MMVSMERVRRETRDDEVEGSIRVLSINIETATRCVWDEELQLHLPLNTPLVDGIDRQEYLNAPLQMAPQTKVL